MQTITTCSCGCGGLPTLRASSFLPGHDARVRGALVRAARGEALLSDLPTEALVWAEKAHGHPCLCGCGTLVHGRFAQGHDAKLRGAVLRGVRGEALLPALTTAARAWVLSAHWVTAEIEEALLAS